MPVSRANRWIVNPPRPDAATSWRVAFSRMRSCWLGAAASSAATPSSRARRRASMTNSRPIALSRAMRSSESVPAAATARMQTKSGAVQSRMTAASCSRVRGASAETMHPLVVILAVLLRPTQFGNAVRPR